MLNLPATTRVFLHREPVDFRKSHDGLCGVIRSGLGRDPLSGDLFVFLNKRRNRVKLIQWDGNGLWLHYKRLEKGTFRALRAAQTASRYRAANSPCCSTESRSRKARSLIGFLRSCVYRSAQCSGTVNGTPPPRTVTNAVAPGMCAGHSVRIGS